MDILNALKTAVAKAKPALAIASQCIPIAEELIQAAETDGSVSDGHKLAAIKMAETAVPGDNAFEPLIIGAVVTAILFGLKKNSFPTGSAS